MIEFVAVWVLAGPVSDRVEHVLLNLNTLVSDRGMVESAENIVHHLVNWNAGVFPGVENSATQDS